MRAKTTLKSIVTITALVLGSLPGGIDVFTGKSMYDSVFDKVIISDKTGERAYTREELEKNDKSSLEALDAAYLAYR